MADKNDVAIGARIRERRKHLNLTQYDLSRSTGIDQSLISRYEKGMRRLNSTDLWTITDALGWPPEKLFSSDNNIVQAAPMSRRIPLLDYVQAGQWSSVQESLTDADFAEYVTTNLNTPPSTFAMRIRGNSMEPLFLAGDVVLIAPTVRPKPGDYVVATDEKGEATFKKYRELGLNAEGATVIELVALNPDFPSMRSDRQFIAIVGKMIQQQRNY